MNPKEYIHTGFYGTLYYKDPEKTIRHRERGLPACDYFYGEKVYWENDRCHRLDGLASDWEDHKEHFLNGKILFVKNLS